MLIRDEQLVVELAADKAYVTISFNVHIGDHDVERYGGIREVVGLNPRPEGASYAREGLLPSDQAVRPSPTATWKELHRTHRFTVPRPQGIRPVRFNGYITIMPGVASYTDEKYTAEGVVPPNFSATPAIRSLSSWVANLVSRLTKRRGG